MLCLQRDEWAGSKVLLRLWSTNLASRFRRSGGSVEVPPTVAQHQSREANSCSKQCFHPVRYGISADHCCRSNFVVNIKSPDGNAINRCSKLSNPATDTT